MINGFEYAWEDLSIVDGNGSQPLAGVVEIEYEVKKEHTNIYGKGDKPVAMGRGKMEFSGKIVLLQSEVEARQLQMPAGKNLTQQAPRSIVVAYAPDGGTPTVDMLEFVRTTAMKKGMKTGDGNQTIELTLAIGNIKYSV